MSTTSRRCFFLATRGRSPLARIAAVLILLTPVASQLVVAQSGSTASSSRSTRSDLAARVVALESEVATGKLSADRKVGAVQELAEIRGRLAEGDFSVGDRLVYTLTVDSVSSDTLSVRDGILISLANLPDLSLKGVLRSELDDALSAHVSRYIKNARIRAITLTQVSLSGAVARPGYYWAAPDRPVSDLIMLAGGPAVGANLEQVEIRRGKKVIMKPKDSRKALIDGSTIEQVQMRSGDEVSVPMKRKANWQQVIQLLFVASSLFFAFIQFMQWYYSRQP